MRQIRSLSLIWMASATVLAGLILPVELRALPGARVTGATVQTTGCPGYITITRYPPAITAASTVRISVIFGESNTGEHTGCFSAGPVDPASLQVWVNGQSQTANFTVLANSASGNVNLQPGVVSEITAEVASYDVDGNPVGISDTRSTISTAGPPRSPSLALAAVTSGTLQERDLCLTMAVESSAAYECGDLRLVHALPSIRVANKQRTPYLVYNSQTAQPHPVFAGNLTLPSDAGAPNSVLAILKVAGVERARGTWSGTDWALIASRTRRIAIGFDAADLATGVYTYTLEAIALYGTPGSETQYPATAISGEFTVVNRMASSYGPGWHIAGHEQVVFLPAGEDPMARLLWIGGDGSSRIYNRVNSGRWAAPSLTGPDTIENHTAHMARKLPHGGWAIIDWNGQHFMTLDRMYSVRGTAGRAMGQTWFGVDPNGRIYGMGHSLTGEAYWSFEYGADGQLTQVWSPPYQSGARRMKVVRDGTTTRAFEDPDGTRWHFTYGNSSKPGRVTELTLKPRDSLPGTKLGFWYDAGGKLDSTHMYSDGDLTSITHQFAAQESQGYAGSAAVDTSLASTVVDGPRVPEAGDTTRFWLDRFGSPGRIRDALGFETLLSKSDSRFPALATRVQLPTGQIIGATYDPRGNVASSTDSSTYRTTVSGSGESTRHYATTKYEWDPKFDFVTKIIPPEKDTVTFEYDSTTGNRLRQRTIDSVEVLFEYNDAGGLKLLSHIRVDTGRGSLPVLRETITYDAKGNLRSTKSSLGAPVEFIKDTLGRDVIIRRVVSDSVNRRSVSGVSQARTWMIEKTITYDLLDRDLTSVEVAPPDSAVHVYTGVLSRGGDTIAWNGTTRSVTKTYDKAGNLTSVTRSGALMAPNNIPVTTSIAPLTTTWLYDFANRPARETAPDAQRDSFRHDPAGNRVWWRTRRGHVISTTFDALGRMKSRNTPAEVYPRQQYHAVWMPHFVNKQSRTLEFPNGVTIPEETSLFYYDAGGRLTGADNRAASVRRTYNPSGTLASETQHIASMTGSFGNNIYTFRYTYDLNGRRKMMVHPQQFSAIPGHTIGYGNGVSNTMDNGRRLDSLTTYHYSRIGKLDSITDQLQYTARFHYDRLGRRDSLHFGNGVSELRRYNADDQVTGIFTHSPVGRSGYHPSDSGFTGGKVQDLSLARDSEGRILWALNNGDNVSEHLQRYTPAGPLARSVESYRQSRTGPWFINRIETNEYDTFEQRTVQRLLTNDSFTKDTLQYESTTGRLRSMNPLRGRFVRDFGVYLNEYVPLDPAVHDAAGNERFTLRERQSSTCALHDDICGNSLWTSYYIREIVGSYYASDGKLRMVDRVTSDEQYRQVVGGLEEYRYDALGRRVLRRYRGDTQYAAGGVARLKGILVRYVYDGDEIAYEIGRPGFDSTTAQTMAYDVPPAGSDEWLAFGVVKYTHSPELDRPLSVTRISEFFTSNGDETIFLHQNWRGLFDMGTHWDGRRSKNFQWYKRWVSSYGDNSPLFDSVDDSNWPFYGSLLDVQNDDSKNVYMRNRYYDPAAGKFTQEDPIGLAGGLNLYGYANGDPVNFSDPFGLCACTLQIGLAPVLQSFAANAAKIATLDAAVQPKVWNFLANAAGAGKNLRITEAFRTSETQAQRYAVGRTTGTPGNTISEAPPGSSYHEYGLAIDVVEIKAGVALWKIGANWAEIGKLGINAGLEWGGAWKSIKDYPHFQDSRGLSIANLKMIRGAGTWLVP